MTTMNKPIQNVSSNANNNIVKANEERKNLNLETQSNIESKDGNIEEDRIIDEECLNEDLEEVRFVNYIFNIIKNNIF